MNWPKSQPDFSHPNWTGRTQRRSLTIIEIERKRATRIPKLAWLGAAAFVLFLFWVFPTIAIMAGFF